MAEVFPSLLFCQVKYVHSPMGKSVFFRFQKSCEFKKMYFMWFWNWKHCILSDF